MINNYKTTHQRDNLHQQTLDLKKFRRLGETSGKKAVENFNFSFTDVSQIKRLLQNQLLTSLPDEDFLRLLPNFEPVSLEAGQQLDGLRQQQDVIYFPEDAVISNLFVSRHGSTIETSMVGKEGLVGIDALLESDESVHLPQVTIAGRALRIKTETLKREFQENLTLRTTLLGYINAQSSEVARRTSCIAFHWAVPRFCTWLLMLHERVGSERLCLTQDQISHALGVHRPSITHAAQSLRSEGLIDYSRGYITIKNLAGLKKAACDCYPETH
jgi:CRP-like cAMP-binding protein